VAGDLLKVEGWYFIHDSKVCVDFVVTWRYPKRVWAAPIVRARADSTPRRSSGLCSDGPPYPPQCGRVYPDEVSDGEVGRPTTPGGRRGC
jgi:hypothetical protein